MKVIKNNTVVNDAWQLVDDGAELPAGDVIVSLGRWQQERDALLARDGQVGVALTGDQDPAALAAAALPPLHDEPFGRMLVAQAQVEEIRLVTADPALARYDAPVELAR